MEALKFGQTAKDHFESIMPGNVTHGWEKYVVTDGETCLLVRSDYKPEPSQMVFLCSIRNGTACVELYRAGKVNKFSTMNALQYGQKVKDHFESIMPGNIAHGWKKYMATDGEICLRVRSNYKPETGQMVFLCSICNGIVCIELYRAGNAKQVEQVA